MHRRVWPAGYAGRWDSPSGMASSCARSRTRARRAGLERGDLIVAVGGREVERLDSLYEALDAARTDGGLELGIVRGTEERTVEVSF